jgi:hypothetical protein
MEIMTKSFKILCKYMGYIGNTEYYPNWDRTANFLREHLDNKYKTAKEHFAKDKAEIDWGELTVEEYTLLQFIDFDENNKNLIPFWLFKILPDDTKLKCFSGEIIEAKDADDDVRFGCTAYMITELKECEQQN